MIRSPLQILRDTCQMIERQIIELSEQYDQLENLLSFLEESENIDD